MKTIILTAAAALALVVFGVGSAMTAHASPLQVSIASATNPVVGQPGEISATLVSPDSGKPMAGVNVTFLAHATFGKMDGFMEVGQGVTNSQGIASISYVPRQPGDQAIKVSYAPAPGAKTEEASGTISVAGASSQLYVQKAGIQVPGLNSWLIVGLLTIVWGTLFGVGVTVIRIARAGQGETRVARREVATAPAGSVTSIP
ncbi:MAG: hypothetical protein EPO22_12790 [Dehalococcoidia bacterium]|nr:MAG: hypothetical protein EPO22_12790 [Dehalococcoidia bacterium]